MWGRRVQQRFHHVVSSLGEAVVIILRGVIRGSWWLLSCGDVELKWRPRSIFIGSQ